MHIDEALSLARRRWRIARGCQRAVQWGVWAAVVAALALVATTLWSVIEWPAMAGRYWMLAFTAGACGLGFLSGFFSPVPGDVDVAVAIDRTLGLRESASTATYLADPDSHAASKDMAATIRDDADHRLDRVSRRDLRKVFGLPTWHRPAATAALLFVVFAGSPFLPSLSGGEPPSLEDETKRSREAQKIREAARKLQKRAEDLERLAAMRELTAIQQAARRVAQEAEAMALKPPSKALALAKLSKLGDELAKQKMDSLGQDHKGSPFGKSSGEEVLSELSRKMQMADPEGLALDLEKFKKDMAKEAQAARGEGREPRVDIEALEDLLRRVENMRDLLDQFEEAMEAFPELADLFEKMSGAQKELLEQIAKELADFAST